MISGNPQNANLKDEVGVRCQMLLWSPNLYACDLRSYVSDYVLGFSGYVLYLGLRTNM